MANFADSFLRGQAFGAEMRDRRDAREEKSALQKLYGEYYSAAPDQRSSLLPKVAAVNPDAAWQMEGREHESQQRRQVELVNRAKLLKALPPANRAVAWQRMAGDVAQLVGDPSLAQMPYDPAVFDPMIDQLAGVSGTEGKVVGNNLVDPFTGRVIYEGEAPPANGQFVQVPDGKGGFESYIFDPRTRALTQPDFGGGAPSGGGFAGPPAGGPAPGAGAPAAGGAPAGAIPTGSYGLLDFVGNGVTMTSGRRTPERNTQVGGVPDSQHIPGTAADYVVPPAMKPQWKAMVEGSGEWQVIDEGDHMHVQRRTGSAPTTQRMGYTPPKASAGPTEILSPEEVAQMGFPAGSIVQRKADGSLAKVHSPNERDTNGGKALPGSVVTQLTGDAEKLNTLTDLTNTFQDKYAGNVVGGSLENLAGRMGGERLGVTTQGQSTWWQQYDRYKNVIRNELFGSALTPSEQAAFEAADITPNMDPKVIRENLTRQTRLVQSVLARRAAVWEAQGYNPSAVTAATRAGAPIKPVSDLSDDELKQALGL